jgi:hypothetical protein
MSDWTDRVRMSDDCAWMTRMRRISARVAVLWLFGQLASAALTPLAVRAGRADGQTATCTCTHGADAACPMHRNTARSKTCVLQSTTGHSAVLLTSLFGITGIVPARTHLLAPARATYVAIVDLQLTLKRPGPPDPPPPRA